MPKPPDRMVNRQSVGTYRGKLHQRSSGAVGTGKVAPGERRKAGTGAASDGKGAADLAPAGKINDVRCDGEVVEIDSLTPDPNNARLHPERNLESIKASLALYGQRKPLVVDRATRTIVAGNGTHAAATALGWTRIAASLSDFSEAEAAGYGLADNRTAELARWDFEAVARMEALISETSGMVGWSDEELAVLRGRVGDTLPPGPSLSERFIVPPFSVLDARQGYWQERKRAWLSLGIQSELGRGEDLQGQNLASAAEAGSRGLAARPAVRISRNNGLLGKPEQARSHYRKANATPGGSLLPAATLGTDGRTVRGDGRGREIAGRFGEDAPEQSGTSIFDPVLCELVYRWFCPPDGLIYDPFAGGSVRGIVAARLGCGYYGVDLRSEQAEANEVQRNRIVPGSPVKWLVGDACDTLDFARRKQLPREFDLCFSCPPYADLERYSDDPRDLSTMPYDAFLEAYQAIIGDSCSLLKNDRFACFVVGEVRNKSTGMYRGFIGDTIGAFRSAGLELYNDAVLVTAAGSLPIRVGRQFSNYRKLGKTHQNVLVFIKGDPKRAVEACGQVEVADLDELLAGKTED